MAGGGRAVIVGGIEIEGKGAGIEGSGRVFGRVFGRLAVGTLGSKGCNAGRLVLVLAP